MTDPGAPAVRPAIDALIAQWRALAGNARSGDHYYDGQSAALRTCANDLEAALRAGAEALATSIHKEHEDKDLASRGGTMEIPEGHRTASQGGVVSAPAPNQNSKPIVFEIEAPQAEMLRTFLGAHQCRPINRAAIGASPIEIVFTELSIAMHCEARCTICKEKVDLNDYDAW